MAQAIILIITITARSNHMETKPLLYGLIGFFAGGLLVSLAATYLEPPEQRCVESVSRASVSQ